jgi:membrane protein
VPDGRVRGVVCALQGLQSMFRTFTLPITWTDLFKRTARATMADNVTGLAAQLAFYFFLALFPALLFLIALASFFPANLMQQMVTALQGFAPEQVVEIFEAQMQDIAEGQDTGLLTFGILATIWSSSAAMVGIMDAMNRAYDIDEARPWWKVRLSAILLTIALALFILISFSLVLVGPLVAEWLAANMGLGPVFEWTWKILQWPVAFALVVIAIGLVYYYAPDAEQDWEWVTPGAALATVLWLIASIGFRIYVTNFGEYNESYGTLGGIMVLMLWFYISGLALLVGAEMNSEIEHASPHGKAPGSKTTGGKRKLGAAAAREHEAAHATDRPARPEIRRVSRDATS